MTTAIDLILVLASLISLALLGSSRLDASVRLSALQGMVLGFLPLVADPDDFGVRLLAIGIITFAMKGFVFPRLLNRAIRSAPDMRVEVAPYVGYSASVLLGIALIVASFWMGGRLALPVPAASPLVLPVAFATILQGLFLIVSRRKALSQVVGYLVMENGIFILGVALVHHEPFLVELGILLDVFVGVFVMGIAIFHISREFDHIDVDQLTTLKD